MRRYTWTVLLAIALVAFLAFEAAAKDLHKVKVTAGRNSIISMLYLAGEMAGIFEKHGIDADVDVRPFKGHMAALPAKEVPCSSYAGTAAIARITKGLDFVIVGGGLTVMQEVFVKKDSPVKSIGDLRGKKYGTWSTGAGAFKATRAVIMDGHGMDVLNKKDMNLVQAAAPALLALLGRGDVDSMFNISSLTVRAASQPDKYRSVFAPNDYWKGEDRPGHRVVGSSGLLARVGGRGQETRGRLFSRGHGIHALAQEPQELRPGRGQVRQGNRHQEQGRSRRLPGLAAEEKNLHRQVGQGNRGPSVELP